MKHCKRSVLAGALWGLYGKGVVKTQGDHSYQSHVFTYNTGAQKCIPVKPAKPGSESFKHSLCFGEPFLASAHAWHACHVFSAFLFKRMHVKSSYLVQ